MKPPRTPSEYQPTTHFIQQRRYRTNPEIQGWIVKETITKGDLQKAAQENRWRFVKEIFSEGEHTFYVVVDYNTTEERWYAITVYCECHDT